MGRRLGMKGYFTIPYAYVVDRNLSDYFWTIRCGKNMISKNKKKK